MVAVLHVASFPGSCAWAQEAQEPGNKAILHGDAILSQIVVEILHSFPDVCRICCLQHFCANFTLQGANGEEDWEQ